MRNLFPAVLTVISLIVVAVSACGGRGLKAKDSVGGQTERSVPKQRQGAVSYTYKVKNVYPHDVDSYTQGLYWHDGYLWEGTGEYGNSKLRKVALESGEAEREIALENKYFGEGIALLGGRIYQLTWREGEAFVYDADTFEKTAAFKYGDEGWGLTTDGEKLYMSDGSSTIKVLDPENFSVKSTFEVRDGRLPVTMLNELEWIDGKIWANVYLTDEIVIIDPATGQLTGRVDLSGLLPRMERMPYTDVLNGIAYDSGTGRIFVTGKKWHKLFEIELVER